MRPVLAIVLFAILNPSFAVEEAAFHELINSRSLRCAFGPGTSTDWESGKAVTENSEFDTTVQFDSIDLKAGSARFIANMGSSDVRVEAGPYGLTFIERPLGGLSVTTVFADKSPHTHTYIAVMSRHMTLLGPLLVSQYHGMCSSSR